MNRITPQHVGRRVSVRRRLSAEGEPAEFGDVVGELTGWSGGVLTITRRDGSIAHVAEDTLVAGKVVPPVPVRGPAAVPDEALERANDRAWPALEYAPLGDWWLRAASGFTRRANSVLPLGDPGVPFDDAVAGARAWYAERGLPTYVQTVVGSPVDDRLAASGWAADGLTSVQTAPLAAVRDRIGDTSAWADRVEVSDLPDTAWLSRYKRVTENGGSIAEAAWAVLTGSGAGAGDTIGRDAGGRAAAVRSTDAGARDAHGRRSEARDDTARTAAAPQPSARHTPSRIPPARCAFASVREPGVAVPIAIGRVAVDLGGVAGPSGAGLRVASYTAIETDPAYRRQGLARAVMGALTDHALRAGATLALLGVETDNEPALALYAALGFREHHRYQYRREPR